MLGRAIDFTILLRRCTACITLLTAHTTRCATRAPTFVPSRRYTAKPIALACVRVDLATVIAIHKDSTPRKKHALLPPSLLLVPWLRALYSCRVWILPLPCGRRRGCGCLCLR